MFEVGLIIGSLRKDSFSKKIGNHLISISNKYLKLNLIDISNLSLYNEDLEVTNKPPQPWKEFREKVLNKQGIIFITPEYNRSIPGCLKNAIDVGSRPYAQSAWAKKPAGIVSISQGALGGFGANQHLRQSLSCLQMPILHHPEAYIVHVHKIFDEAGNLSNNSKEFLKSFLEYYASFLKNNL